MAPKTGTAPEGPQFAELSKQRVSDQLAGALQSAITSGQYDLGQRLPSEHELARTFKTSRGTVREALRILEAMGFVEIRTGAGAFVSERLLTPDALQGRLRWLVGHKVEVLDLLAVREALETYAAGAFAARAATEDVDAMRAILEEERESAHEDRAGKVADAESAFHKLIAAGSGNPLLDDLISYVVETYRASNRAVLDDPRRIAQALDEHRRIFEAISSADVEGSERLMKEHLRALSSYVAGLETEPAGGAGA